MGRKRRGKGARARRRIRRRCGSLAGALKDEEKLREAKMPSASGSGTISRVNKLGWAFDPSKKDPKGCYYVDDG